jgi:hypothetical protein
MNNKCVRNERRFIIPYAKISHIVHHYNNSLHFNNRARPRGNSRGGTLKNVYAPLDG